MKKNNCILGIILLLGLALAPMNTALSADNNLVQVDLKKGSGNAVDITFFTSENYGSNVIVKKKSDNKYVILMPKVLTSGYRSADLESVRDLVTNIDVKSVNDGAAGYTKITMITTKPLNITTHVSKAVPLTDAQKQYKTLIAEAYTVKNNVNKSVPQKTSRPTEVTVNKAPSVQAKNTTQPKNTVKSVSASNNKTVAKANQTDTKTQANQSKTQTAPVKLTPVDTKKLTEPKKTDNIVAQEVVKTVKEKTLELHTPDLPPLEQPVVEKTTQVTTETNTPIEDIKVVQKNQNNLSHKKSILAKLKNKIVLLKGKVQHKMPVGIATTLIFTIVPLIALIAFLKLVHSSIKNSLMLKKSFLERISKKPRQKDYEHIINNENLNWQEKYQLYINQSRKENTSFSSASTEQSKYKFVTQTQKAADSIEEQRQKLERLVTPERQEDNENKHLPSDKVIVHSEEQTIDKNLKDLARFKAFEPSLHQAKRNVKLQKSRFKGFAAKENYQTAPVQPQPTVELKKTPLTQSTRQISDANLKVSDVKTDVVKDDYVMSSLEEFFTTPEKPVADTLAQIKPSMKLSQPAKAKEVTNPIAVKKVEKTEKPTFSGLIVKTGCNIDDDRGFYIVNLDGTSALVGRIKEDVVILKKFDDTLERKLQVRHDKDNIYMVKTDGFKSLIDAANMGVLVEL